MKANDLKNKALVLFLFFIAYGSPARGQNNDPSWGVKTNLLYDATATLNLGVEFATGDRTSFDLPVNWNPFTFSANRKWKHLLVQPEFRLWTRRTFDGHFFGLHAHYAYFNVGNLPEPFSQYMRDHRFEGWLAGAGLSYGYRWNFSHRWGLEATLGAGYAYKQYEKFPCNRCGERIADETKHYFGPTKAGLSLVYSIGKRKPVETVPVPMYVPPVVVVQAPKPEPELIPVELYMPRYEVSYVVPAAEAVKTRSESGRAYLDFAAGKSEIVSGFKGNAAELEKIHRLIEAVRNDPDATITGISIRGYASPEGTYATNLALSEKRAAALKNHVRSMYGFPESMFAVSGGGEDWAMLDTLVAQSDLVEKYAILGIIRGTDIFDGRERKLMDLAGGSPYRTMKSELFPQLRRTEYQLHYTVLPFTVERGKEVFRANPAKLSLNEMFLIANTYQPGSDPFNEVFETAARIFPQDDVANLNAAASALSRGDAVLAERYLSKVRNMSGAYHNNMGVLYGLRERWDQAVGAFGKAQSAGIREAADNVMEIERKRENIEAIARQKK